MTHQTLTVWIACGLFSVFSLLLPSPATAQKRWIIGYIATALALMPVTLWSHTATFTLSMLALFSIQASGSRSVSVLYTNKLRHFHIRPLIGAIWLAALVWMHTKWLPWVTFGVDFAVMHTFQILSFSSWQRDRDGNHYDMQNHVRYLLATQHNTRVEMQSRVTQLVPVQNPPAPFTAVPAA